MTVRLDLNPEIEARIKALAAAGGMSVDTYLQSLIEQAARRAELDSAPGVATLALLDAWEAEDDTDDAAELARRRREFEDFQVAMNASRPGQRAIFP